MHVTQSDGGRAGALTGCCSCRGLSWRLLPTDADECTLFGEEVCRGGFCRNTAGSYECYCQDGHVYDLAKLECTGQSLNTCSAASADFALLPVQLVHSSSLRVSRCAPEPSVCCFDPTG